MKLNTQILPLALVVVLFFLEASLVLVESDINYTNGHCRPPWHLHVVDRLEMSHLPLALQKNHPVAKTAVLQDSEYLRKQIIKPMLI